MAETFSFEKGYDRITGRQYLFGTDSIDDIPLREVSHIMN